MQICIQTAVHLIYLVYYHSSPSLFIPPPSFSLYSIPPLVVSFFNSREEKCTHSRFDSMRSTILYVRIVPSTRPERKKRKKEKIKKEEEKNLQHLLVVQRAFAISLARDLIRMRRRNGSLLPPPPTVQFSSVVDEAENRTKHLTHCARANNPTIRQTNSYHTILRRLSPRQDVPLRTILVKETKKTRRRRTRCLMDSGRTWLD